MASTLEVVGPHSFERSRGSRKGQNSVPTPKRSTAERFRNIWPDLREMILPRRKLLALGLVLMVINRLSGMVLPYSTKFLIDDVIGKHHQQLLTSLVLAVLTPRSSRASLPSP